MMPKSACCACTSTSTPGISRCSLLLMAHTSRSGPDGSCFNTTAGRNLIAPVRLLEGHAHYASFFHGLYSGLGSRTAMWLMSGSSSP